MPAFISFTGSTDVGRGIGRIASGGEHLKHVALELGGNSPFVVLADADVEATVNAAVVGKFLAAWAFIGFALVLTFPMWLTVNYLGRPDNGVILTSYIGSFLMAGAFLAIGSCISALTKNQVLAANYPFATIEPNVGTAHRERCLNALALYEDGHGHR